jgi:mono/diheme cytochrome c family protein
MKHPPMSPALIASILAVTANAWGQSALAPSVAMGRADYKDRCASCHGAQGQGDGPLQSFLVRPPTNLTTIARRNGGRFPHAQVQEMIDGRWLDDSGPHGSREMPVWGQRFKDQAMDSPDDSPRTAERAARYRVASLTRYLETIQVP